MQVQSQRAWPAVSLVVSLGLSGCAQFVERVAATQDTRTLNPDSVQGQRGSKGKLIPILHEPPPDAVTQSAERFRGQYEGAATPPKLRCTNQPNTFLCLQEKAQGLPKDTAAAHEYLLAGLTLSNELCDAWFTRLQVTQVTFQQTADSVSAFGSVTNAILGFTQTPPEQIGLTASLFGIAKQSVDRMAVNYVVAPDLTAVSAAVREYRALYAADIERAPQSQWNYFNARRVIMAYDNTCSALFVKRFINLRVEGKSQVQENPLFDTAIGAFADTTDKYFAAKLDVATLVELYAWLYVADVSSEVRASLKASLEDKKILSNGEPSFKSGVNSEQFRRQLIVTNIDMALKERAIALVASQQAAAAAVANAKAAKAAETAEQAKGDLAQLERDKTLADRPAEREKLLEEARRNADAAQQNAEVLKLKAEVGSVLTAAPRGPDGRPLDSPPKP